MTRFLRILGHAYKVVPVPDGEIPKLAHLDHDQRVIFVRRELPAARLRAIVLSVNGRKGAA